MRDSIKHKIHRLIRAINDALSESDEISDSLDGVRDEGYDLFLILEATVVLDRDGEILSLDGDELEDDDYLDDLLETWDEDELDEDDDLDDLDIDGVAALNPEITEDDEDFLRTLKIRLE